MRRQPSTLTAYVLHQYDWSESSLIVELFTREQGRIVVAAKGAKRPYSQLRAVLLPFNRIQISLGRASRDADPQLAEVQTLRSAEWAGGAAAPSGAALFSGFYLNELLLKLLARSDPHPGLFDVYAETLPALAGAAGEPRTLLREPAPAEAQRVGASRDESRGQAALRAFELKLLQETGLLPDLAIVTSTLAPVAAEQRYRLSADQGVVSSAGETADLSGRSLVAVQAALQHGSIEALRHACAQALPAWRGALRGMLQYHLGNANLRTRQLMIELQSFER